MPLISIRPSDRVVVLGATGMGKTTFMRRQLDLVDRFVVLDPKHGYTHRGVPIVERINPNLARQIIRLPRMRQAEQIEAWGDQIDIAYEMRNIVIYADELTAMTGAQNLPSALDWANRTGRSRNVALWSGTQRPRFVPNSIFSEAQHFFFFKLQLETDRRKAEEITIDGIADEIRELKQYDAIYVTNTGRKLYLRGSKQAS